MCLASIPMMSQAAAPASGYYAGGEFGKTDTPGDVGSGDKNAMGIFAGYKFANNFSVELGYRGLLTAEYAASDAWIEDDLDVELDLEVKSEVSAIQLAGQYTHDINQAFAVTARAGVASIETEVSARSTAIVTGYVGSQAITRSATESASESDRETLGFLGIGAEYRIQQITLRATYDYYQEKDDTELSVFAVGAAWNF